MQNDKGAVSEFYDSFLARQLRNAYNERHLYLFEQLKALGLKEDSSVLEIGCGAGIITSLICEVVKTGRVVAIDISPESIRVARQLNAGSDNVTFLAGDVGALGADVGGAFDLVVMFDVLEHIPLAEHPKVLSFVASKVGAGTRLVVNIPSPQYNAYLRDHEPGELQVIDEILETNTLLDAFYRQDLTLHSFRTYGIWLQDQYQLMVLKKRTPLAPSKDGLVRAKKPLVSSLRRRLKLSRLLKAVRSKG